jgi:alginate O-acetyltransferase complex protein AlgI
MLFNSLHYLIFFPLVVLLFYRLPVRFRTIFLVAASCYFYMVFKAVYILILFTVITVDYLSALYIERSTGGRRRLGLVVSIASNIGILFVFKYYDFAADNAALLSRALGWPPAAAATRLHLLLPIGLSFHTFQSLAYIVEVFKGRYPAERNPLTFALYVLFFPQMVAGPIERPQGLLRQLHFAGGFSYATAVEGMRLILIGFWNKMLVADNLAPYVDAVYSHPSDATGFTATLATLAFAVQIYCDFCGYSQIAIGSAKVLGIDLMTNFDHPYRARSIADFWHRWHISLSTWFRDYVYIPLGGSRVTPGRKDVNTMAVFLLSGLWHGANWTYLAWGGLHGSYLVVENHLNRRAGWRNLRAAWPAAYRIVVFLLVCLAWVFFRARSLADACGLLRTIFTRWATLGADLQGLAQRVWASGSLQNGLLVGFAAYAILGAIERLAARDWTTVPRPLRWALYYGMVTSILLLARFESRSFIYFQF